MCNIYEQTGFNQENVYKWIKQGFATMSLNWKDSLGGGNTLIFW